MALIKHAQSDRLVREAIVLDLGDLQRQAELLKARARDEADGILRDAKAERERLILDAAEVGRRDGFEQGQREGLEHGRREGHEQALAESRTQFVTLATRWEELLDDLLDRRDRLLSDARHDLIQLSLAIAEQVVLRTIETDPKVVERQMIRAIDATLRPTRLVVEVSEADLLKIEQLFPTIVARLQKQVHAEIHADGELPDGSCRVRTGDGSVDASIPTLLSQIAQLLIPDEKDTASTDGAERT